MNSLFRNGATLVGGIGPSGPNGPRGASGPTGPNGSNGINGASGPSGPSGSSGPNGPVGSSGVDGAFELPSLLVNPGGGLGHQIFAVGTSDTIINDGTFFKIVSSVDDGATWVNYGNLPSGLMPRCFACNTQYLLTGGAYVPGVTNITVLRFPQVGFSDSYRGQHDNITFEGGRLGPLGPGDSYPTCTRIVWWPYYQKFLIVLSYTVGSGKYTFRIWSLQSNRTDCGAYIYESGDYSINSFELIDINVNGPYGSAIVYNHTTGESNMIYSTNGGTDWNSTTPDTLTSYMSILPYYGDSWLRFSAGMSRVNGAVAVSVTGSNFDSSLYPSSMGTLGSSYQVLTPADAGFIYGAAFNGKVWCAIMPKLYNTDGTVYDDEGDGLKICTSYDLRTAISGNVNSKTFIDSNATPPGEAPRVEQINPTYLANHSSGVKPRIVWTGQVFIVFGEKSITNPNAGILRSLDGFEWVPVDSQTTLSDTRNIYDICFTSSAGYVIPGLSEYNRFMVSSNSTFSGKMTIGLSCYVKNISTTSVEVSTYYALTGNTILIPANSSPYGGVSRDAVITTDENAPDGQENSLLIN